MESKVIVFYASCGQGHKKAAESLSEFLNCRAYDILDFAPLLIRRCYSWGYLVVTRRLPLLWCFLYEFSRHSLIRKFIQLLHLFIFKRFLTFLREVNPGIILSTHFFPPALISSLKKKTPMTNFVVVTDLRVHPFWIEKGIDRYFVAREETKEDLIRGGIAEEKIVVSGIPLRQGFYQQPLKSNFRERFGRDEKPIILFFSADFEVPSSLMHLLDELGRDFNFFVICGKNKKLQGYLNRNDNPSVAAFSFYENIWELMNISLAVIGKPGGMTVCESLRVRKPLIFTHYIWGQEKNNMDLVTKWGIGFYAPHHTQLKRTLFFIRDNYQTIQDKFPPQDIDARHIIKTHLDALKQKTVS